MDSLAARCSDCFDAATRSRGEDYARDGHVTLEIENDHTVMASVSDLAAVGADTVGILLNLTLAVDASDAFISRLRAGIRQLKEKTIKATGACLQHKINPVELRAGRWNLISGLVPLRLVIDDPGSA